MKILPRINVTQFFALLLGLAACSQTPTPKPTPAPAVPAAQAPAPGPVAPSVASAVGGPGKVVVLFVSDLHGQLRGDPVRGGGYARLAGYIKNEHAKADLTTDVIAVMGGDALGKSGLPCRKTGEKACVPFLKDMGIDVASLGNGELKRSVAELNELISLSGISWVGTNVTPTGKVRPLWQRSFHYRGPRTGAEFEFIGWTTPPSPGEVDPVKAGYRVEMSTKNRWPEWKQIASQRQIFWITHQDWDSDIKQLDDACRELGAANLAMLKAHTHENREDRNHCAPIFEPGAFGERLSRVVFARTAANAPWSFVSHEFVKLDDTSPRDTVLAKKIDDLYKSVAPEADEVVAQVGASRDRNATAQWLADTLKKVSAADVSFVNMGAVKSGLDTGPVTRERLLTTIPYAADPLMGTDISATELGKAMCQAAQRSKNALDDEGADLVLSGAQLVGAGTPACHLEGARHARVKLVLSSYLVKRSARWLGVDLAPRAFKFGMDTEQAMMRGLQLGGHNL